MVKFERGTIRNKSYYLVGRVTLTPAELDNLRSLSSFVSLKNHQKCHPNPPFTSRFTTSAAVLCYQQGHGFILKTHCASIYYASVGP